MTQNIVKYIALKVMEDIRSGWSGIYDDLAYDLAQFPLIDTLRDEIQPDDVDLLIKMAKSGSENIQYLALHLLKNYVNEKEVKTFLLTSWKTAGSFKKKMGLLGRLLDIENLDQSVQEDIRNFIEENLDEFIPYAAKWFGGADNVLAAIRKLLSDDSFPESKHWMDLYVSLGSADLKSVVNLLKEYILSEASFISEVAKELLNKPIFEGLKNESI